MAGRLSKRRVDAAKPGETIWDGELPGFGMRVSKGGARSYVLKYRRGAIQRWLTIGRHGAPWTPATARKAAMKLLAEVGEGGDPAARKALDAKAETLAAFSKRYLEEYAQVHKKVSTTAEDARLLKNHILPELGNLRLQDIQRADVARFHRTMKEIPYSANRCLALLSHMVNVAQEWGDLPDGPNPCRRIKKYPERSRERFLSAQELKRLGAALTKAETKGLPAVDQLRKPKNADRGKPKTIKESNYVTAAIRLLIFTGARLSEILTLEWRDVDLKARLLRLRDSKTGEKTIVLAAPALEVLQSLPRQRGNPYVICGRKAGSHLINIQKPWRRIRASAGLDDVRIHDLRHSFASVAAAGGMSLPLIGSLLGHTQAQTTQRYAHLSDDPRIAAADSIAAEIAANLSGTTGKVVSFKK